ncbi:hypothetical protein BJF90_40930 [Pseudonocardia sp. CNS-004]|nr:hypothetical protein BJF90_40930 [Pseudonocardia sp. CNS-004]
MPRSGKSAPGWADARVTVAGALAMCLSAPGQTAAVSVFVDPVAADLGVSRTAVSTAYLIGTLAGTAALPLIGRAMDRRGAARCCWSSARCSVPSSSGCRW